MALFTLLWPMTIAGAMSEASCESVGSRPPFLPFNTFTRVKLFYKVMRSEYFVFFFLVGMKAWYIPPRLRSPFFSVVSTSSPLIIHLIFEFWCVPLQSIQLARRKVHTKEKVFLILQPCPMVTEKQQKRTDSRYNWKLETRFENCSKLLYYAVKYNVLKVL